jgi:mono/diheme cytochrome c family protein
MKVNHMFLIPMLLTLLSANPANAADTNEGRNLYQQHCAMCHGVNGNASMAGAADFKRGQGLMQSDKSLLERIQRGKNACPSYLGILSKQQTFDVIAFIRTLF